MSIPALPQLNVQASNLGREGIRMAVEGQATGIIGTMTGTVTSPEVFMMGRVTMSLLKSQPLSDAWKVQMESSTLLGQVTVRPDVSAGMGLSPYVFNNCAIFSLRELNFGGEDPGWVLEVHGFYVINNNLWQG